MAPRMYRGIRRNEYQDFLDPPFRPGQIEVPLLDAIQDAIATDSRNPDDITLHQGKTAIWGPSSSSSTFMKKVLFNMSLAHGVEGVLLGGILPITPGMDSAGIDARININYQLQDGSIVSGGSMLISCVFGGCVSYQSSVLYDPGLFIDPPYNYLLPYNAGETGYATLGIYPGALGYVGSPGAINIVHWFATEGGIMDMYGDITYRLKEGVTLA